MMGTDQPSPERQNAAHGRPLKVLVAVHRLDVGGSQMNAIDLAAGVRDRGHDVVVAGPPGPLVDAIRDRRLGYQQLEPHRVVRGAAAFRRLLDVCRSVRPDILHTYEWSPTMLATLGPHLLDRLPLTVTVNSMSVPDFLPRRLPLQVCSPLIASELDRHRGALGVLEIPTDCSSQHPGISGSAFREEIGLAADELAVVVVSRFARELKQQGLETLIRAATRLRRRLGFRLVLVGDGPAMPELRTLATEANRQLGCEFVVLTGARVDPRPAYAAANIVVGMGGSLLRAMAFGKACVVQGECGFWRILDLDSAPGFRWHGFYGIGPGGTGEQGLAAYLEQLLGDPSRRAACGDFALALVRRHYSLEDAVDKQIDWYRAVLAGGVAPRRGDIVRSMASLGAYLGGYAIRRVVGVGPDDDFNSRDRIAAGIKAPAPADFDPDLPRFDSML